MLGLTPPAGLHALNARTPPPHVGGNRHYCPGAACFCRKPVRASSCMGAGQQGGQEGGRVLSLQRGSSGHPMWPGFTQGGLKALGAFLLQSSLPRGHHANPICSRLSSLPPSQLPRGPCVIGAAGSGQGHRSIAPSKEMLGGQPQELLSASGEGSLHPMAGWGCWEHQGDPPDHPREWAWWAEAGALGVIRGGGTAGQALGGW